MPTGRPASTAISAVTLAEVEHFERFGRKLVGPHGLRLPGHLVVDAGCEQIGPHVAAQVAVGDDADEPAVAIGDADAAEALARHLDEGVRHARTGRRQGQGGALVHDVAHELEHGAEPSGRVQEAELARREAAAFEQRDGERVAERELHQRGGGGREVVRAGLARLRQGEHHVRGAAERAVGFRRDGDEADVEAAGIVDEVLELHGLARPRQCHDEIVGRDHAEVAVARLARVHEEGGRTGRGEGRRHLAADVAGLAHPGDDQPALGAADQIDRGHERAAEPVADRRRQRGHPAGFRLEGAQRRGDERARAVAMVLPVSRRWGSAIHPSPEPVAYREFRVLASSRSRVPARRGAVNALAPPL